MNTHVWLITAKTNLHVGNENTSNYGIIDNAIQRDALTQLPCINSSSLKGAINEFCTLDKRLDGKRINIFGSDKKDKSQKGRSQKGKSIFLDAQILFLPVQSDTELYSYVTSKEVLDLFLEKIKIFHSDFHFEKKEEELKSKFHLNKSVKIIDNVLLSEYCKDENLPIIARNVLENGISKNLWYEQVLPPQTVLYAMTVDEDDTLADVINGQIIQIGANATVGYGYCKFVKL